MSGVPYDPLRPDRREPSGSSGRCNLIVRVGNALECRDRAGARSLLFNDSRIDTTRPRQHDSLRASEHLCQYGAHGLPGGGRKALITRSLTNGSATSNAALAMPTHAA
jgi:hypothetical protein